MKKNFVGEFRKYDKINCTIFDLIGGDLEPKQTMALGYLFSKSRSALNAFLKLIGVKVTFDKCIVDCEPRRNEEDNNDRIDILLRLYQDEHPVKAIIIEAKSVKAKTSEVAANNQVQKYVSFPQLKDFSNIETVTLTQDVKTLVEGSTSITWLELVNELSRVQGEEPIIKDFINYILNIKGNNMKHYEEEIVSIPAGNSYEAVVSSGIYECPVDYNTPKKALFMTFREKDGGAMRTLYKLLDVLELDLDDEASIEKVDKQLNLKDRLDRYKSIGTPSKGVKKVYVLDVDNAITLPIPVTPMENNTSKIYYKLGDFIGKCNTNKGDNKDDYRIVSPFKIDGHTLSVPRSKRNCILKKEDGTLVKDFSCNEGSIELNKEYVYELFVQGDKRSIRLNKIRISYEAGSWKMFYDYKK
ncbi:hypothetical protein [Prevotellamassilia timonensis]|jgi:hypothetical protein|uniref:hypothetical protein n=1 Tax=Prevotellamassilia timonensis TaxID=1852370 RepID=UPI00307AD344